MKDTVSYNPNSNIITLIDQNKLPHRLEYIDTNNFFDTAICISDMNIRGAGAIGAIAAFGMAQGIRNGYSQKIVYETLLATRPTAVDLKNGLDYVKKSINKEDAAIKFAASNKAECLKIGKVGNSLIKNNYNILTHCNAGALAFVNYGSALSPIYEASKRGKKVHVFVDETRPRLQGAKLTAWELSHNKIPNTVITDNAAGFLMAQRKIDMVLVGADRILKKTGEIFNKIGTYSLAILAKYHNIPFYVCAPHSTLDPDTNDSIEVKIEERGWDEVCEIDGHKIFSSKNILNYAFDITPQELITGYIFPSGIYNKIT